MKKTTLLSIVGLALAMPARADESKEMQQEQTVRRVMEGNGPNAGPVNPALPVNPSTKLPAESSMDYNEWLLSQRKMVRSAKAELESLELRQRQKAQDLNKETERLKTATGATFLVGLVSIAAGVGSGIAALAGAPVGAGIAGVALGGAGLLLIVASLVLGYFAGKRENQEKEAWQSHTVWHTALAVVAGKLDALDRKIGSGNKK